MTAYRIRGPHGRVTRFEVPGPGVSEATFGHMIDSGEWTIVPEEPAASPGPKRAPGRPRKKPTA
jgi:hypothetical protein